jgi:F-type H+-transporting ATPase subunit gamma
MRSLKEVRSRITSVTSTRKITSAMKMVSSVKLRKAQDAITRFFPYKEKLDTILSNLIGSDNQQIIALSETREVQNVSIVVFSSNGSLCGAYNTNVYKKTLAVLQNYKKLPKANIHIYGVGKKAAKTLTYNGHTIYKSYDDLSEKVNYNDAAALANLLMEDFIAKRTDEVVLVYNHFKNTGIQIPQSEVLLPISLKFSPKTPQQYNADYILEPNREELIIELLPKAVRVHLYSILLDMQAAEQGARTTAMQIASDNAEDLIQELKSEYNKVRQESITKQILDIVGGAEAFRAK